MRIPGGVLSDYSATLGVGMAKFAQTETGASKAVAIATDFNRFDIEVSLVQVLIGVVYDIYLQLLSGYAGVYT